LRVWGYRSVANAAACATAGSRTLNPEPGTLNPAPCMQPEPCTLHPAPCTLHPAPCTLHPERTGAWRTPQPARPGIGAPPSSREAPPLRQPQPVCTCTRLSSPLTKHAWRDSRGGAAARRSAPGEGVGFGDWGLRFRVQGEGFRV
jgi:hypothetical protein